MKPILLALGAVAALAACNDSDDPATTPASACASYCASMGTTCTGADVQYTALTGTCATYCETSAAWAAGTSGASSGNSLACRVTHVALAAASTTAGDRTLHCGHAGPSGGNACGTWCENYCQLAIKNCGAYLTVGQMGFTDAATCATACAAFPTGGTINGGGDSVQCRVYHAGAAGALGALPHCSHAAVTSGNTFPSTAAGPCS